MGDTAKLFRMHSQIAKFHMFFLMLFIIYISILSGLGYKVVNKYESIALLIVFFVSVIDFIYSLKEYRNDFFIIRIIRAIEAILMSVTIILFMYRPYISITASVMCILLIMQIAYLTDMKRVRGKCFYFVCIMLPMLILSAIYAINSNSIIYIINTLFFDVFLIMLLFIALMFVSHIFAENRMEKKKLETELTMVKETSIEKLNRENSEMLVENLIQQYISSSLEIPNLMKLILESLSEAMVVNLCSIIVIDGSDSICKYSSRSTYSDEVLEQFNKNIEQDFKINRLKELKEPYIDNNVAEGKYRLLKGVSIKSLLIYPLKNDEQFLGVLIIGKDKPDYFKTRMAFFARVSTQFSIALTNASTYTKMEDMATKDGLTGIYNRIYLSKKLNEYISEAILKNISVSILMFDIDNFKSVNDNYGHMFGDEVIRVCANVAHEAAKEYGGFAARYGGEEFVVINRHQSLESQKEMAKFLHNRLKETCIEYMGNSININVSIGVASYPDTCKNPAELIDRADKAMYNSKKLGKGMISYD